MTMRWGWTKMSTSQGKGFTLVEVVIALACASVLIVVGSALSFSVDRANRTVSDRLEAEHAGQATLNYIVRELQTATAFYIDEAKTGSIGYKRPDGTFSRIGTRVNGEAIELIREEIPALPFPSTITNAEVLSEGINELVFTYTVDGVNPPTPGGEAKMFYVIYVDFTITVGGAVVSLHSAVSTLNIIGVSTGGPQGEVV